MIHPNALSILRSSSTHLSAATWLIMCADPQLVLAFIFHIMCQEEWNITLHQLDTVDCDIMMNGRDALFQLTAYYMLY